MFRPFQRFKTECFGKTVESYNYFCKALYLTSLTGFWIGPSLNKYSLTCRVIWRYVLYEMYSESCLLLSIHIYSGIFMSYSDIQSYCGIFRTLCNSCISTTLPQSEFRTLPFSELCHIGPEGIFRYIQCSPNTRSLKITL